MPTTNSKPKIGDKMLAVRLGRSKTTYHRVEVKKVGRKYMELFIHGNGQATIEIECKFNNGAYWCSGDFHIYENDDVFLDLIQKHELLKVILATYKTFDLDHLIMRAIAAEVEIPERPCLDVIGDE